MSLQDLTIKLEVILFHAINRLGNNAKVNFLHRFETKGIFPREYSFFSLEGEGDPMFVEIIHERGEVISVTLLQ